MASSVVSGKSDIVFEFSKPNNSRTSGSSKLFGPALPGNIIFSTFYILHLLKVKILLIAYFSLNTELVYTFNTLLT